MSDLNFSLDWRKLDQEDCCQSLYEIGGALRRMGRYSLAQRAEKIASALYPGEIKPAPIVPRTISG